MDRVEIHTNPAKSEVLNRGRAPFPLENAYFQDATLGAQISIAMDGFPQEVTFAAIQGFTSPQGSVGFHREPSQNDTPPQTPVTEMYFPLVGEATATVENTEGEPGYTNLQQRRIKGQFTREQLDAATLYLQQGEEGPELQVVVEGQTITLKPEVVIPAGNVHGTLAHVDGTEPPLFFALKLKRFS